MARQYYAVLVASAQYHGEGALVYSWPGSTSGGGDDDAAQVVLTVGSVVKVPLQKQAVLGVVAAVGAQRPRFATKDILEVYNLPPLPAQLLELAQWLRAYYPAPLGAVMQLLLPSHMNAKTVATASEGDTIMAEATAAANMALTAQPSLTAEQSGALKQITQPDTYLLHGETGSGKTRVYIELAARCVQAGQSAIILTPEIGLTSQLAASFRSVFGERVVVVHSAMTPKARQQTWLRIIRSNVPLVVVGPRSALFSPLSRVGLIVVDESHEPAYKQESAPHYHAVRVAAQLAHLHGATLVLGSATPSVIDYYIAEQKQKPIIRMTQLAAGSGASESGGAGPTPAPVQETVTTQVVDLKDRTNFVRSSYLSTAMLAAIDASLNSGQQSLLYLNRRGTARVILCNNCGWQAVCPNCDLPLTYHHDMYVLQCHTCGFKQATPTACPDCGNTDIVFKVVGTKAIEEEVRRLYPSARVKRFDTDNKTADRFEKHYEAVLGGEVDILVGTQLLAKGLDLPRLSTLGVVVADTSLTFPDYSAEERTYQLLAQVMGRVGRGHMDASGQQIEQRIVVQSYAPERPVIQAALAHDWQTFYATELAERQLFKFPPFCYLLKLTCRRAASATAERATEQFLYSIQKLHLPLLIEGPMPSFHARIDGKYEWQLVIKSKQRPALLRVIELLKTDAKSGWNYDIDPINLL